MLHGDPQGMQKVRFAFPAVCLYAWSLDRSSMYSSGNGHFPSPSAYDLPPSREDRNENAALRSRANYQTKIFFVFVFAECFSPIAVLENKIFCVGKVARNSFWLDRLKPLQCAYLWSLRPEEGLPDMFSTCAPGSVLKVWMSIWFILLKGWIQILLRV